MTITVDVLCIGYGAGALAAAVLAAGSGMSVMYIEDLPAATRPPKADDAEPSWTSALAQRWGINTLAPETALYLDKLTGDLGAPPTGEPPETLTVTELEQPRPAEHPTDGSVPPFYGSRLQPWARQCLNSTTGIVSTRVSFPGALRARSSSGESMEVSHVLTLPRSTLRENELHGFLLGRARDHGVQALTGVALKRLLFEEGNAVGGVISAPDGTRIVWTRFGVILGLGSPSGTAPSTGPQTTFAADTRLCLNSRRASRFGRLELVRGSDLPRPTRRNRTKLSRHNGVGEASPVRNGWRLGRLSS